MRTYNNFGLILLLIVFGTLLSCNGKKRPWSPQEEGPPGLSPAGPQDTGARLPAEEAEPVLEEISVVFADVQPLFEKHCMSCHAFIDPKINWLDQETAKLYIENGILYQRIWELRDDPAKGMPLGNAFGMTEEERKTIVKWIEGGGQ